MENIFARYSSNKGLMSKIYKELKQASKQTYISTKSLVNKGAIKRSGLGFSSSYLPLPRVVWAGALASLKITAPILKQHGDRDGNNSHGELEALNKTCAVQAVCATS